MGGDRNLPEDRLRPPHPSGTAGRLPALPKFVGAVALILAVGVPTDATGQSPAVDYGDPESWLCLPDRDDACRIDLATTVVQADGTMTIEEAEPAGDPPIDCFYVYPTVSTDPTPNSDMIADAAELNVVRQQFARFGSVCRLYAPIYRQVTVAGLSGTGAEPDLNGRDVLAAWRHYLANRNDGRGVVLIGHSQGSYLLRALIAREIDGRGVQNRLVSALLLGATMIVPEGSRTGGSFQKVPVCTSADEAGCLVSFGSYRSTARPPDDALFGRVDNFGMDGVCVSPSELLGRGDRLHGYFDAEGRLIVGTQDPGEWVAGGADVTTPWVSTPGLITGRCAHSGDTDYLEITVHGDPADPRTDDIVGDLRIGGQTAANWGLHLIDMNLTMGDLVELVRRQGAAWLAEHR